MTFIHLLGRLVTGQSVGQSVKEAILVVSSASADRRAVRIAHHIEQWSRVAAEFLRYPEHALARVRRRSAMPVQDNAEPEERACS